MIFISWRRVKYTHYLADLALFFMHCTTEWMNLDMVDPSGERHVFVSPQLLYLNPHFS